ncbi:MAG TPA: dephospho-CoA kinase [Flavobacterium sp.]|nr:dephospho-CoA kinase [Flavobacterium sp.]
MTKVVGLTGGIGTGKTTVSKIFAELGVPVYIADTEARRISEQEDVQARIIAQFGPSIANSEGGVDRRKLAAVVFSDPEKLGALNALIHPLVKADFQQWLSRQGTSFVIREAAILFESGTHIDCDKVIVVTAPLELRIFRVMARDHITREEVLARMDHQWPDSQKIALSDYVIVNEDLAETRQQILKIFTELQHL